MTITTRTIPEKIAIARGFLEKHGYEVKKQKKSPVKKPIKKVMQDGFLRQPQVLELVPFSSATLWRKCTSGKFPSPVRLSERITAWREQEVRAWLNAMADVQYTQRPSKSFAA